jgi:hypothetical protein
MDRKKVTVTLDPETYRLACIQAAHESRDTSASTGVANLLRHALRRYLSKNRHRLPEEPKSGPAGDAHGRNDGKTKGQ